MTTVNYGRNIVTNPTAQGITVDGLLIQNGFVGPTGVKAGYLNNAPIANISPAINNVLFYDGSNWVPTSSLPSLTITNIPLATTDAVNKEYVDAAVTGLNVHPACRVYGGDSDSNLVAGLYANGSPDPAGGFGIGATLTDSTSGSVLVVDGVTLLLNDRVLINFITMSNKIYNGIYALTTLGVGGMSPVKWVLTRATDSDNSPAGELGPGDFTFVYDGSPTYKSTSWVQTCIGTGLPPTSGTIRIGLEDVCYTQFNAAGSGVSSFSAGTTGFTPNSAVGGAITLSGILVVGNGGTGASTVPTNGQLLIGNGTDYTVANLSSGTGISTTVGAGTLQINNTGVTSFSAGATGLSPNMPTSGAITLSGTLNALNGGTGTAVIPNNGQLLIGNGIDYTVANLSSGTGISTTVGMGTLQINNTGVTSFSTGTTGFSPNIPTSGAITLSGTLNVINGGTGTATIPTSGQLLIGNGIDYTVANLSSGTGISTTVGLGSLQINNTGVTSFSAGTTGFSPNMATTGAITLSGTLNVINGGTGTNTIPTSGQLLIGNGIDYTVANLSSGTGISTTVGVGTLQINNTGVTSFSAGTTGFSPNMATTGAITLTGTLNAINGGTGQSIYTVGDILYANTTTTLSKLADVATGNVLLSGGINTAPSYGKVDLTTTVSGILPSANGGTGVNNGASTITLAGSLTTVGANPLTLTTTGSTNVTLPTSGTLLTSATAVTSLTGTTNQVSVSASTGPVTLSIPSTFLAPGTIKDTTGLYMSTQSAVSAAGATQGTATALTTTYNVVTTVALGTGVVLPVPAASGLLVTIVNKGANTLNVYPAVGGTIDAAALNAAVTLEVGASVSYQASSTTQWYTINPPVTAGTGISISYNNGQTLITNSGAGSGAGILTRQFLGTSNIVQTPAIGTFVTMFPASFIGSLTFPANTFASFRAIQFNIAGIISSAGGSNEITLRVLLGPTANIVICTSPGNAVVSNTNVPFNLTGILTIRTTGAIGTIIGSAGLILNNGGGANVYTATTTTTTASINTTVANTMDVQLRYSAGAGNTFTTVSSMVWLS